MNIETLKQHADAFNREVVNSGFKRDLEDYIASLPASQNWIVTMPAVSSVPSGTGRFFRGSGRDDLKGEGIRALAFGDEPDGSRTIYDFPVQVLPPKDF